MKTIQPADSDASQLVDTVQRLIQAGCHYRLDALEPLYADDLRILLLQADGQLQCFDRAANLAFFRARQQAGAPPLDTTATFHRAEVHDGLGYVIVSRLMDLGAGPQHIVFNLMLRRGAQGQWQVFREQASASAPSPAAAPADAAAAQREEWLFSYGTLQQPEVQQASFGRLLQGHADSLPGFVQGFVTISDPAVVALSGKAQHPALRHTGQPGDTVAGMVFAITRQELHQADAYETADYRRAALTLQSGRRAWVYVDAASTLPAA